MPPAAEHAVPEVTQLTIVFIPFNALAVSWIRPDRLYRIYCTNDALRFVRIRRQSLALALARGLEAQAGPVGESLSRRLHDREQKRLREAEAEADSFDPEFLISTHKHNFRLLIHEVTGAHIFPAGLPIHGPHFARLHLRFRRKERIRLQFQTSQDVRVAMESLPRLLGGSFVVAQKLLDSDFK